jgi:hypothetical protein
MATNKAEPILDLDRGLEACRRVRDETETIVLKFSSGKDSLAMWLK